MICPATVSAIANNTAVHRTMAQPVPAAAARTRGKIAEMRGPI